MILIIIINRIYFQISILFIMRITNYRDHVCFVAVVLFVCLFDFVVLLVFVVCLFLLFCLILLLFFVCLFICFFKHTQKKQQHFPVI